MLNDEYRTTEEAYTSATQSSNLRCEADRRTDVDVLIAAGWTPGILGGALMRLRSEYDSSSKRAGTVTDAMMLMAQLKSLPRTLAGIEVWAAERQAEDPKRLAQAVLAQWLDSTCRACSGRGMELIPGTPTLGRQCKACRGNGKRKDPMGDIGRMALNMMDECVQVARNSIKKRLRPPIA